MAGGSGEALNGVVSGDEVLIGDRPADLVRERTKRGTRMGLEAKDGQRPA